MKKLIVAVVLALVAVGTLAVLPSETSYTQFSAVRPAGTKVFTFNFKTTSAAHVTVLLDGVKQAVGYTVALNLNQVTNSGGKVTFTIAPDGKVVRIERNPPFTQACSFSPFVAFRAATLEGCFDAIVGQTQQLGRRTSTLESDVSTLKTTVATGTANAGSALVAAAGSTTPKTLSDWTALVRGATWETAPTPYILAHRGQLDLYAPEHTWEAYEAAESAGAVIEMDVRATADGALVAFHDLTTTRTTGVTGTVKQLRLDDIRRLNAANHAPWSSLTPAPFARVPTFEEYLRRYGGRSLLVPELDSDVPTSSILGAVASIQQRGLQQSVLWQSFNEPVLSQVYAVDPSIRLMMLGANQTDGSVANAVAAHAWAVSIDHRELDQPYVTAAKAAGLKVIPYTVNDVETAEKLIGWGADGFFTDDPLYFAQMLRGAGETPSGTTIAVPLAANVGTIDIQVSSTYGTIGSGWRGKRAGAGGAFTVTSGYATFSAVSDGASSCVIYPGIRTPEGTWTLTTNLKLVSAAVDTTRYIGLRIGRPGDNDSGSSVYGTATSGNGYNFFYRQNGTVSIERVSGGAGVQIASDATWPALNEGDVVQIRVDTTPTTVTFTRVAGGKTISATDNQKSRRGFVSAFASGAVPGLGSTTLTY